MDIEVVQQSVTPQLPVLALLEVVSAIGVERSSLESRIAILHDDLCYHIRTQMQRY